MIRSISTDSSESNGTPDNESSAIVISQWRWLIWFIMRHRIGFITGVRLAVGALMHGQHQTRYWIDGKIHRNHLTKSAGPMALSRLMRQSFHALLCRARNGTAVDRCLIEIFMITG